jgi:hypothetical protein
MARSLIRASSRSNLVPAPGRLAWLSACASSLAVRQLPTYAMHMNRTNPALDKSRRVVALQIVELRGSGLWEGDLSEMRGDGLDVVRRDRDHGALSKISALKQRTA